LIASHDAALAPASRDNRRVARLAPRGRQDSLGDEHAANVFGARFAPDENYLFATENHGLGLFRAEHSLAYRGSWNCVNSGGHFPFGEIRSRCRRVDNGIKQPIDVLRLDALDGLFLG